MERSYKFMVKHVQLWKVAFHSTSPRWVHNLYLAAIAAFHAKKMEAGLKKYKPDIIIGVHPLMQHIPLWVLKWQNLQKRVIFETVITDLGTCHPTWFHTGGSIKEGFSGWPRAFTDPCVRFAHQTFLLSSSLSQDAYITLQDELRKELEMDPQLPAVLLMGGGEGMMGIDSLFLF
nr:PREDICTED: probable monogalactosyldiacylglycerol synthase 3, chloroplastic [Musa acuminata subsp. malaccensis]